jgi:MoaA/NifB/PqqE/SkfB family radical SAM enzyme
VTCELAPWANGNLKIKGNRFAMNLEELKIIANSRDVYLWGARQLGFSTLNSFNRKGVPTKGFLDSSQDLQGKMFLGKPVISPKEVLSQPPKDNFIVITSSFFNDEISEECKNSHFAYKTDFINAQELQVHDYIIDISGSCNLKCISCAWGNIRKHRKPGFMSANIFEKVLHKIILEDPMVGAVALYNFGEPLINPQLPDIIRICNSNGIFAAISSNLCYNKNLKETIQAKPSWFRVSTSGYGANYEITHTGGKWDIFLKNMHLLAQLCEKYSPETEVEVFYHIYKDRSEDYKKMVKICEELRFKLRVRHAFLFPLDNIYSIVKGESITAEAEKARNMLIISVDEAMEIARKNKHLPCSALRCLDINWDLKVQKCACWFSPDQFLEDINFLDNSLEEIINKRVDSDLCKRCKKEGIHRYLMVYGNEDLVREKQSLFQ